jgi:hypothetical protein
MQLHIKLHIKKVIYVISWPSFHYKNQSNTYEKEVIRGINSKKTSKEKEEGGGRRGERGKGERGRWKKKPTPTSLAWSCKALVSSSPS